MPQHTKHLVSQLSRDLSRARSRASVLPIPRHTRRVALLERHLLSTLALAFNI